MQGRKISQADQLADAVRATLQHAMPIEVRGALTNALGTYARTTGYLDRLGCRRRRQQRAKLGAA